MLSSEFDLELYTKVVKEESAEEGWERGIEKGIEKGRKEGEIRLLIGQICRKLRKNQSVSAIAEMLEEDETYIQEICRIAEPFAPDYDENMVYEACTAGKDG